MVVLSPGGVEVGNVTVAPDATTTAGAAADIEFPLTDFGEYAIRVTGRMTLAKFSVGATLTPADKLDLDFWWDQAAFGTAAKRAMADCSAAASLNGVSGVPASVGRVPPPGYPVMAVVVAVVGAAAAVAVVAKLTMHMRSTSTFKRLRRS